MSSLAYDHLDVRACKMAIGDVLVKHGGLNRLEARTLKERNAAGDRVVCVTIRFTVRSLIPPAALSEAEAFAASHGFRVEAINVGGI